MFSLTLEFIRSADYRAFILRTPHLKSPHAAFFGVLSGTARIYVKRNLQLCEVTLTSNGALSDILFDLRQWIEPHTVILKDFAIKSSDDFLLSEFNHCLHACVAAWTACFAHPHDPESFHQLRLALRSFRSHLQILRKIRTQGLDELRAKTKILAKSSNELRDVDVRIELYDKFGEAIPASLVEERKQRLDKAVDLLIDDAADIGMLALRSLASLDPIDDGQEKFSKQITKQTKKAAKRWRKLDLKEDAAIHALRIKLKMLTYGYNAVGAKDEETIARAKSIKAIQSRLGDVRDLRSFYRLAGLDTEVRYRVVQKLSSLERELEEMEIK
ncbi:MAG: CHAD domain-containing protein [Erysipelotrichaceae bacterium]